MGYRGRGQAFRRGQVSGCRPVTRTNSGIRLKWDCSCMALESKRCPRHVYKDNLAFLFAMDQRTSGLARRTHHIHMGQRRTFTCFDVMNRSSTGRGIRRQRFRRLCRVSGEPRSITPSNPSNKRVTVLVQTFRTATIWSGLRYSVGVELAMLTKDNTQPLSITPVMAD
jgi:hypothetical protein